VSKDNSNKKNNKSKFIILLLLAVILIGFIAIAAGMSKHNSDGTSKAAVYTKVSDFGTYSDWAQKQLSQGSSMCSIQNKLAETNRNVSVVPNCDSGKSVDCTTTNIGITTNTQCHSQ
jgi:hypothetical protein